MNILFIMNKFNLCLLSISIILTGCANPSAQQGVYNPEVVITDDITQSLEPLFVVAFGSCSDENKPQPMLDRAVDQNPDVFVYLGDNIYGDTYDMSELKEKYDQLRSKPEFVRLWQATQVQATWDDHDYGWNDMGRHYTKKVESEQLFLDAWQIPESSERRQRPGIYGDQRYVVERLDGAEITIQLIILDSRYFRDDLTSKKNPNAPDSYYNVPIKNDYAPTTSPDSTLLGNSQWTWVEQRLREPADVRIIASSIQFGHTYNGWESWTNLPHERARMLSLIKETGANGVVFISGDVHWGEISKLDISKDEVMQAYGAPPSLYPIYDVTSSGITQEWYNVEPNGHRVGHVVRQNNVGLIELYEIENDIILRMSLLDLEGRPVIHDVPLSKLRH
ncbi:MAG TPA: hypothetical protein DEF03_01835 [Bacteroidetes bacterium]|nr:hypothetical protein [Bacteroidota bacterium]